MVEGNDHWSNECQQASDILLEISGETWGAVQTVHLGEVLAHKMVDCRIQLVEQTVHNVLLVAERHSHVDNKTEIRRPGMYKNWAVNC